MITIELKRFLCSGGCENKCFVIDGVPLHEYLQPYYERYVSPLPAGLFAVTWNAVFDT